MNILITGGASGLGASIVKRLAKESNNLIWFTYAKSADAAKQMQAEYKNTLAVHCDFTSTDSIEMLLSKMESFDIDVLINNASNAMHKEHFHKSEFQIFKDSFEHNVLPALRITQAALKSFRKKRYGKIINIISAAVVNKPPIGWSSYTANKSYLLAMSKSWATENISFNITSNCISPAFMLTNLTSDTDERIVEQMKNTHPLKSLLSVEEVAESVLFFVNATQQINGTNLIINAGESLL